jgi:predicted house-cleaning noncanonical NTP pyrophosphatase (MazG superfamily)
MQKLVRDLIPDIMKKKGQIPDTFIATESEYSKFLIEKLSEEVKEYCVAENEEELTDILEIIDTIIKNKKFSKKNILKIKNEKNVLKGKFEKKIILKIK